MISRGRTDTRTMRVVSASSGKLFVVVVGVAAAGVVAGGGCACGERVAPLAGDVEGRLCNVDTGVPLAGIDVVVDGDTVQTDDDGAFRFDNVAAGRVVVVVQADGRRFDVDVAAGATAVVDDAACSADHIGSVDGQLCDRQ